MSPFTRYIKLKINDNHFENYIFQEKISKFMIERYGYREGPILEYDEKNLWNKYSLNLENKNSSGFYKIDNAKYVNNKNNLNKIFKSVSAKTNKTNSHHNIYNELFETVLILMGGCHGLHEHNRKYYYDSLNQIFLPIYYDGMLFYDKSNNLCETFRKNSNYIISKSNFYKIKHILNNDQFKKKINKIFFKNVFDHDKFEYYWEYLENNLEKLETILKKMT